MSCAHDDIGGCCGKCDTVIAIIPVHGRRPLLRYTLQRLKQKNKVGHIICIGDDPEDRKVCEQNGAEFVTFPNSPLGAKWNAGFQRAGQYNAEACLFVGSSDWLSDNWLPLMMPYLNEFDMVGKPGCHFLDISSIGYKCMEWPGYDNDRKGETIGIGRILSGRILKKMNWKPFNDLAEMSMDSHMNSQVLEQGGRIHSVGNPELIACSISTDKWINKHRFSDHEKGVLKSRPFRAVELKAWIENNFPEAFKVFEQ